MNLALRAASLLLLLFASGSARACPFCRTVNETISDKLEIAAAVVIVKPHDKPAKPTTRTPRMTRYELLEVLKDTQSLLREIRQVAAPPPENPSDAKLRSGKLVLFGALEKDSKDLFWLTPRPVSDAAIEYLKKLPSAPSKESGPDRLAFFQEYLNDPDDFRADDAYDEIARASYADVKLLGPRMQRDKLLAWVQDERVSVLRRRQFLTMLAVCGQTEDAAVLEKLLQKERGGPDGALDATVACYLVMTGEAGLPLVEKKIISSPKTSLSEGLAVAAALRFHGEEEKVIPRERLLVTLRLYLDRPAWADQAMPELARWKDWSVLDRMARLFEEADRTTASPQAAFALRVPIVKYMEACPLPEAKKYLAAFEKSHPDAVKAASLYPFLPVAQKSSTRVALDEDEEPELLPPPRIDTSPEAIDAKIKPPGKTAKSKVVRPAVVKERAETEAAKYPVVIVGLAMLFSAAAILGLLMVILFGFRPRSQ